MNYWSHKIDSSKLEKSDTGNRGQTVGFALFTSVCVLKYEPNV